MQSWMVEQPVLNAGAQVERQAAVVILCYQAAAFPAILWYEAAAMYVCNLVALCCCVNTQPNMHQVVCPVLHLHMKVLQPTGKGTDTVAYPDTFQTNTKFIDSPLEQVYRCCH